MRHLTKIITLGLTLLASAGSLAACGSDEDDAVNSQPDGLKKKKASECGGLQGLSCKTGEFCNYAEEAICGAADATGVCTPLPEACAEIYKPVCGCDDKTYGNECEANRAGVSVGQQGACAGDEEPGPGCDGDAGTVSPATCGGIAGLTCPDDQWCNYEVAAGGTGCGDIADASGVCQPRTGGICTQEYNPVCGCDGETYGNACTAHAAGVSIASQGECGGSTGGGNSGGTVCGGLLGGQCAKDEFCNFAGHTDDCGLADGTGICTRRPEACTLEYNPVCGCDGKTYGNACAANGAGVSVESKGECAAAAEPVNCDQRDVLCKRATPKCPAGTVPSVVGSCYGDCVAIDQCACSEGAECPQPDLYTCHLSAGHCGPFVN